MLEQLTLDDTVTVTITFTQAVTNLTFRVHERRSATSTPGTRTSTPASTSGGFVPGESGDLIDGRDN